MKRFYWIVIALMVVANGYIYHNFTQVIIPVEIVDHEYKVVRGMMSFFNIPYNVAKTFYSHGKLKEVDPILLASIAVPESARDPNDVSKGYNPNAVSSAGYTGRMMSTTADKRMPDEVEILNATVKLVEFTKMAKGDTELALRMYNGGVNPSVYNSNGCKAYARKVLTIYAKAKSQIYNA